MDKSKAFHTSSAESANKSAELGGRLRRRIIALARKVERVGLTINEAEVQIDDHKGHSVSPRFAELVRRGLLIRARIGHGKPTRRFPNGVPHYVTRYDETTQRKVTVHWAPEFAPSPEQSHPSDQAAMVAENERIQSELENAVCQEVSEGV